MIDRNSSDDGDATVTTSKVWLVTGAGRGLGRSIVDAIVESGHYAIVGTRRAEDVRKLQKALPDRIHVCHLDVTDPNAARSAASLAVDLFGRLDVVVNNAGYGHIAPFEQLLPEQFDAVIRTCFFGVVNITRAALPIMRRQRSGIIFQISSVGGRVSSPGNSAYNAAKWAVGGFSDSVRLEASSFGVSICTLEPGSVKTGWSRKAMEDAPPLWSDYDQAVGPIYNLLKKSDGQHASEPMRIAKIILGLANQQKLPGRLLLGRDASDRVREAELQRRRDAEQWIGVTLSTQTFEQS